MRHAALASLFSLSVFAAVSALSPAVMACGASPTPYITLGAITPSAGAVDVSPDAVILVAAQAAVNGTPDAFAMAPPQVVGFELRPSGGDGSSVVAGQVLRWGEEAVFVPAAPLAPNTTYEVGATADNHGLAAGSGGPLTSASTFTTGSTRLQPLAFGAPPAITFQDRAHEVCVGVVNNCGGCGEMGLRSDRHVVIDLAAPVGGDDVRGFAYDARVYPKLEENDRGGGSFVRVGAVSNRATTEVAVALPDLSIAYDVCVTLRVSDVRGQPVSSEESCFPKELVWQKQPAGGAALGTTSDAGPPDSDPGCSLAEASPRAARGGATALSILAALTIVARGRRARRSPPRIQPLERISRPSRGCAPAGRVPAAIRPPSNYSRVVLRSGDSPQEPVALGAQPPRGHEMRSRRATPSLVRARLLLNPSSGNESGLKHLTAMVQVLRERFDDVEVAVTTGPDQGARAAATAIADGCTHLFVAGGDGTVNEALRGVDSVAEGFERVVLGIVPLGTGNDLASHLGLPREPELCLRALLDGREARLDLGRLNGQHVFLNASAGGYVAESSVRVSGTLKTFAGPLAYALGGTAALLDWEPARATIVIDGGETLSLSLTLFAVGNARTVGGGNPIAPHARVDDGLLDLCVVKTAPLPSFLATLGRLSRSEHHEDEDVVMRVGRTFSLSFERPLKVNVDGEVIELDRCDYAVDPARTRLLVPASRGDLIP